MENIYFIAAGGVGQSALAKILSGMGYNIEGSDLVESKYTKMLEKMGVKIHIGQSPENIKGNQTIVISSAIKEDNPELKRARELNLKIIHRSDCLKFISEQYPCFIGLAGTHGKTTTSGMLSYILEKANAKPTYAIGGFLPDLNINANVYKDSKYFIAELDESDGTIQKYKPNYFLINNLEEDHLDHYKDLNDIIETFKKTVSNMEKDSKIFINIDNNGNRLFLKQIEDKNIITYSIDSDADYTAKNIIFNDFETEFEVCKKDEFLEKIKLIIPGMHNVYNALGIIAILDNLGFKISEIKKYFEEFSGMGRRFQQVADVKGIKIIDDYAHHPSEIKSTLSAVKNVKRRKIAIFQPHRYTRLKALWNEFLNSFDDIDKLYVLDVFTAGDIPDKTYNSKNFVEEFKKLNKFPEVKYIEGNIEKAAKEITPELKQNDAVLTLGAGDITKIGGIINDLLTK